MTKAETKIVADGYSRLSKARDYGAVTQRITREVRQRHEEEKKASSIFARLRLEVRIRREIRAEIEKEFPSGALYVAGRPVEKAPNKLPLPRPKEYPSSTPSEQPGPADI